MIVEVICIIGAGALGVFLGRRKPKNNQDELIELQRQNALYIGANPLKCLDCNTEFTGPLVQPNGGCPKCSSSEYVVPMQNNGCNAAIEEKLAHKPPVLTKEQIANNILIRDELIHRITSSTVLTHADSDDISRDITELYGMYTRTNDKEIVSAFIKAQNEFMMTVENKKWIRELMCRMTRL